MHHQDTHDEREHSFRGCFPGHFGGHHHHRRWPFGGRHEFPMGHGRHGGPDFGRHQGGPRGWSHFVKAFAERMWGGHFGNHGCGPGCGSPFEEESEESTMRGPGFKFGPGWGRGGRRPFEHGDLKWIVLDLIAPQPRHGYEIIKAIEEGLDGHYSPSPGVIYPTLTLLEETGLIAGETQGAKKLYTITDAGRAELTANAAAVDAVRNRLKDARADFGGVPAPEVMRAMHNLRSALQVRLSRGGFTRESVNAICAAIDRAAAEIERS